MALFLPSRKFHHVQNQWRVVAGGHILLRVTWRAQGGTIMTPTADDDHGYGCISYPDRNRLIQAMQQAVDALLAPDTRIWLDEDEDGRQFLEMHNIPTLASTVGIAKALADAMATHLQADTLGPRIMGRLTCRDGQLVAA